MAEPTKVKIRIEQDGNWPPTQVESLWVEPVGPHQFRIRNVPFFARDVALDDVIRAKLDDDGNLWFEEVTHPSENETVRVFFEDLEDQEPIVHYLTAELGCTVEGTHTDGLVAVNIPPGPTQAEAVDYLSTLKAEETIGLETGTLRLDWR